LGMRDHLAPCVASLRAGIAALSVSELDDLAAELMLLQAQVRAVKFNKSVASQVLVSPDLVGKIMMHHMPLEGVHRIGALVCQVWRATAASVRASSARLLWAESQWQDSDWYTVAWQPSGEAIAATPTALELRPGKASARRYIGTDFVDDDGDEIAGGLASCRIVCDDRPGHNEIYTHNPGFDRIVKAVLEAPPLGCDPRARVLASCCVNEEAGCGEVAMACANGFLFVLDRFDAVRVFDCEHMLPRCRFGTSYYLEQRHHFPLMPAHLLEYPHPKFTGNFSDTVFKQAEQGGITVSSDWVVVADKGGHRLQVFALHPTLDAIEWDATERSPRVGLPTGPPARVIGGPGVSPGKFTLPGDVKFLTLRTADDALLVLEHGFQEGWSHYGTPCPKGPPRLQVLTFEGVPLHHVVLDPPPHILQARSKGSALCVHGRTIHALIFYFQQGMHGVQQEFTIRPPPW